MCMERETIHKLEVSETGAFQHICEAYNTFHKVKVSETGLKLPICEAHHKFVIAINRFTKVVCQTALHQTTTFVDL